MVSSKLTYMAVDPPLGYLMHRLHMALRSEITDTVLGPLGLTFPEYICLRMLQNAPGASNADLARNISVTRQAMNLVLRGLQDRNLVTRPPTVEKGRARPAELTAAGSKLLRRTDSGIQEAEDRILATLSDDDRAQFRRILAALL